MSTTLQSLTRIWDTFISSVWNGMSSLSEAFGRSNSIELVEGGEGTFTLTGTKGSAQPGLIQISPQGQITGDGPTTIQTIRRSRLRLAFRQGRFLQRELSLPEQARDFADRILKTEIDRLTPWPAEHAIFGHQITASSEGKISVAIVAADRRVLQPLIDHVLSLRPRSLEAVARIGDHAAGDIVIFENKGQDSVSRSWRMALSAVPLILALAVGVAAVYEMWAGSNLEASYDSVQTELRQLRAGTRQVDPSVSLEQKLIQKRLQGPVATLIIEDLSRVLPDDTYLTDIELAGLKIRFSGVSRDATALVRLVESSGRLSDASFFAPTTRDATEAGEKFHIEATVKRQGGVP